MCIDMCIGMCIRRLDIHVYGEEDDDDEVRLCFDLRSVEYRLDWVGDTYEARVE